MVKLADAVSKFLKSCRKAARRELVNQAHSTRGDGTTKFFVNTHCEGVIG
jgi:hypothetical protein